MVALKREIGLKEISAKLKDPGKSTKAKFGIFGVEIIEKEVKPSGNSGRIYLPLDWVGKHVKIIRVDWNRGMASKSIKIPKLDIEDLEQLLHTKKIITAAGWDAL